MSMPARGNLRPRRYRRATPRAIVLLVLLVLWVVWRAYSGFNQVQPPEAMAEGIYEVDRAVDGDTLLLANGARVRLMGVDTPETVKPDTAVEPWGPEAAEFTRRFIERGNVRLQFDRERQDQYERFLAYVWVENRLLNEELLRAGLARWEPGFHYSQAMKTRFRRAQEEAQAGHRGLWQNDDSATAP